MNSLKEVINLQKTQQNRQKDVKKENDEVKKVKS